MMRTNLRNLLLQSAVGTFGILGAVACGGKQPLGMLGDGGPGWQTGGGFPWTGGQGGGGTGGAGGAAAGGSGGVGGGMKTGGAGGTGGTGGGTVTGGSAGTGGITISGGLAVERAKQDRVNSIDLLFVIDNSSSMADKQAVLRDAVPQLVKRLVNPGCVNPDGTYNSEWNTATMACPAGTTRDFDPVTDIHIGIVSSSLGGHGASVCLATEASKQNLDMAHLLTRGASVPPAGGFLAWDGGKTMTVDALVATFSSMVAAVGETGCGYEAPLEAAYRFLNDPEPYATVTLDASSNAVMNGIDQNLLAQRAEFLRPDSMVAVISVTDEDDCSIWEGGQNWVVLEPPRGGLSLIKSGTQQCASNPSDPCCQSCSQPQRAGCPDIANDPKCQAGFLTAAADPQNLRCFDQKRKYGYDFLYPVQRYIDALTGKQVANRAGVLVPNPLFSDLSAACRDQKNCAASRDPSLVLFAGIVGVPWQDIAKDPQNLASGFKTAANVDWQLVVGNPANNVLPTDPLMIQSVAPRAGAGIAAPNSGPNANPINGHEWEPQFDMPANADLQYACVFPLPTSRVCTPSQTACDCNGTPATRFNPLCQNDQGQYATTQVRAKAYPGTRHLQVLQGLGDQGIVASACPAKLTGDKNAPDYGYNPAINALADRMRTKLRGQCLPVSLKMDSAGAAPCNIIEGYNPAGNQTCTCEGDAAHLGRVTPAASMIPPLVAEQYGCICQIVQLTGAQLTSCQNNVTMAPAANGWCYVDPSQSTSSDITGSCAIVNQCAATDKRIVRFSQSAEPRPGATVFVSCDPKAMSAPPATPARTCP
jgi:hypothetical protein